MKEEFKKFFRERAHDEMCYGCSEESWMKIIDEFFDKYQPERLNPETHCQGCDMDKEYPGHAMYVDHSCSK